jgi:hypothetical protein
MALDASQPVRLLVAWDEPKFVRQLGTWTISTWTDALSRGHASRGRVN